MLPREEVEFKSIDGLTLRGTLYPAARDTPGPGVILAPGVSRFNDLPGRPL